MGFGDAIKTCFAKYADFDGRAARPEYWYFVLFNIAVSIVLSVLGGIAFHGLAALLQVLFSLAMLLPNIAVGARRLHDRDQSGWWLLIAFVPVVGAILLLVWFCLPGTRGNNRYGASASI